MSAQVGGDSERKRQSSSTANEFAMGRLESHRQEARCNVWGSLAAFLIAFSNPVVRWHSPAHGCTLAAPEPIQARLDVFRASSPQAFFGKLQAALFGDKKDTSGISFRVREAAEQHAAMAVAIAISGGATSDFSAKGGYPRNRLIQQRYDSRRDALNDLLVACAQHAPALVANPAACLPVARLAMWVPSESWVRPLEEWEGADLSNRAGVQEGIASLRRHLLEKWDTPGVLHDAVSFVGSDCSARVPEAAHRASYAFTTTLAAAGAGDSVRERLAAAVCGAEGEREKQAPRVISKAVAKYFLSPRQEDLAAMKAAANPLHALRRAQVAAQGGDVWVADGVCRSEMGQRLLGAGSAGARNAADGARKGVTEVFGDTLISWVCLHAEALEEPSEVCTAINFALEMRRSTDPGYLLAGKTPKSIARAMEQYALTSMKFRNDEAFEPNPYGVRGLFETGQVIQAGTVLRVPYDNTGRYVLGRGSPEGYGARPCTIRVAEILSLGRLILEGEKLGNCLEDRRSSQVKYVMRARQRSSSFWSFTIQYDDAPDEEPKHILLAEVWHLRRGNIIRQAEGPRPRTLPGPEAWYWLSVWCKREGVDLSTWDMYSWFDQPDRRPPVV